MTKIPVVFLQYKPELPSGINGEYWDMAMIHDLIDGKMWTWEQGWEFEKTEQMPKSGGAVIVMPARQQTEKVHQLNADIAKLDWVVLMLTGDEESDFPFELVEHPKIRFWVMSPRPERHTKDKYHHTIRHLGSGYTPKLRVYNQEHGLPKKELDWFYAGQSNHKRRKECAEKLANMENGILKETPGFTQGMPQEEYYEHLTNARIAPCPSGGHTPDTFRLFEALECACFPIADEVTDLIQYPFGYWEWFFETPLPFYPLTDYGGLKDYTTSALIDWKHLCNKTFAWWQQQKRQMAYNLRQDIKETSGMDFNDNITVLMPTSTIREHPSTEMIEKTIADVRTKLPTAEIIIMVDGLNEHFADRKADYEEYTRRLLWKCNNEWQNVVPIVFDAPTHQVGMTRKALELVKTPTILFVEHDCPLTPDVEFEYSWEELIAGIMEGEANVVRFHHEARILPEHEELMIGGVEKLRGVPMRKTMQWSQRPHLASSAFYRKMLEHYFKPDAFGMIEDHIYGKMLVDCRENGIHGWYNWRVWVFHPEGENIKRSYTLDGRGEDSKHDEDFHY